MSHRIMEHPVLDKKRDPVITFLFNGKELKALENEMISSALFASGIHEFGKHHMDDSPQGIFCANGQCGQCLVLVDGIPKKACLTPVTQGMKVESMNGLPPLPPDDRPVHLRDIQVENIEVLIVGAGPAGLAAAMELGAMDVPTIIADDKDILGGKLILQTHNFFGSKKGCFAGMRGAEIASYLAQGVSALPSVDIWMDSPVVGVFSEGVVGVAKAGSYRLLQPRYFIVGTGAREKMLAFPGCDLPGIYGAGAFQTLVNRDLVKAADKLFIVGGGNVGLIAAYQALQAGIDVLGIVEALPRCGGYKVHLDKIKRLGVPIYTSHTIQEAMGKDRLDKVAITRIDSSFKPIEGTRKEFSVDTLLIAVGLSPVNELYDKAKEFGINAVSIGDTQEIAEASAAMFSGKIAGRRILEEMGHSVIVPRRWDEMLDILRKKPGPVHDFRMDTQDEGIYPIIRCIQEIPCNPCSEVCPLGSITIPTSVIEDLPAFKGECVGCGRCVAICPGLAINLVDRRYDPGKEKALVILPWEMPRGTIDPGMKVNVTGFEGEVMGQGKVVAIKGAEWQNRRQLVSLEVPWDLADGVAGIRTYGNEPLGREVGQAENERLVQGDEDIIICRCERITKGDILREIRAGVRDMNDLKARLRVGMGPCGGKTCIPLIEQLFRWEGVKADNIAPHVNRPFFQEIPMDIFFRTSVQKSGEDLNESGGEN